MPTTHKITLPCALTLAAALWLGPPAAAAPAPCADITATWRSDDDGQGGRGGRRGGGRGDDRDGGNARRSGHLGGGDHGSHGAPEIDPGLYVGGAALLVGGTLVLLGQRRKRRQPTN